MTKAMADLRNLQHQKPIGAHRGEWESQHGKDSSVKLANGIPLGLIEAVENRTSAYNSVPGNSKEVSQFNVRKLRGLSRFSANV